MCLASSFHKTLLKWQWRSLVKHQKHKDREGREETKSGQERSEVLEEGSDQGRGWEPRRGNRPEGAQAPAKAGVKCRAAHGAWVESVSTDWCDPPQAIYSSADSHPPCLTQHPVGGQVSPLQDLTRRLGDPQALDWEEGITDPVGTPQPLPCLQPDLVAQ